MTEPPHFRAPSKIGPDGRPITDPQGSDREIQSCIYNILVCRPGHHPTDPSFGVSEELLRDAAKRPELLAQVRRHEPRATEELLEGVFSQPDEFPNLQ